MGIRFYANVSLDPYSDMQRFESVDLAKIYASEVGHFHVYEYSVEPGIPGVEPESETLVANHYVEGDQWIRDVATP